MASHRGPGPSLFVSHSFPLIPSCSWGEKPIHVSPLLPPITLEDLFYFKYIIYASIRKLVHAIRNNQLVNAQLPEWSIFSNRHHTWNSYLKKLRYMILDEVSLYNQSNPYSTWYLLSKVKVKLPKSWIIRPSNDHKAQSKCQYFLLLKVLQWVTTVGAYSYPCHWSYQFN